MRTLEGIAHWICELDLEKIPEPVRKRVQDQCLSVLAATLVGSRSQIFKRLGHAISSLYGEEQPGLLQKLELLASASMIHDYDDYLFMGHTGHSAIWVPLLLGQYLGASSDEILTAMVIANELGGRLGAAILFGPLNGQMWSPIHRFAAAGAAARLLKLDQKRTTHALALSLYHPEFPSVSGFMGSDAKVRSAADSLLFGVKAAFFAAEGVRGSVDELENPRGFFADFCYAPLLGTFTGLGQSWVTLSLAIKPFPGCAYVETPVLALQQIRDEFRKQRGDELYPPDLAKIRVYASALTIGMDLWSQAELKGEQLSPILVNFSTPLSLACQLLFGEITPEILEPDLLESHREMIFEIAHEVELIHDLSLTLKVIEAVTELLPLERIIRALSFRQWCKVIRCGWERIGLNTRARRNIQRLYSRKVLKESFHFLFPQIKRLFLSPLQGFPPEPLDFTNLDFSRLYLPFPARVEVILKDGTRFLAQVDHPPGASGTPSVSEISRNKWLREGEKHLSKERVHQIFEKISRFEFTDHEMVRVVDDLLRPLKPNPTS